MSCIYFILVADEPCKPWALREITNATKTFTKVCCVTAVCIIVNRILVTANQK